MKNIADIGKREDKPASPGRRVLLVDDHALVRRGLKDILLESIPNLEVIEASDAGEAMAVVAGGGLDAAVLDISLPGRSGMDVLKDIRAHSPRLPVLILSMYPEEQFAVRAIKAGAAGYLTKETAPKELALAAIRLLEGGRYINGSVGERLAERAGNDDAGPPHEKLSDREYEILRLIAAGREVSEIARKLGLSVKTVSTYRSRLLEKMDLKTNAELMRYAMERGLTA